MFTKKELSEDEQIQQDLNRLRALGNHFAGYDGDDENLRNHANAFHDMLNRMENGRLYMLNVKQRSYVNDCFDRFCGDTHYENLVSSGQVPRGKEVPPPEVLRPENLPKLPPHRRPR
jgi:hypothetical protein